MRRLVPALLLALFPLAAQANPETGEWIDSRKGVAIEVLGFHQTAVFTLSGGTDSELIAVEAPSADLCFDPDKTGAAGSARVSVYRLVDPATATTNASILLPPVPSDNSDCLALVRGLYWVEVTTAPTGGEVGVVSINTRSN
jgi:hypothetical protein